MLLTVILCLASGVWQDTPNYLKVAIKNHNWQRSATAYLESTATIVGPELDADEEAVLMKAVKATVDRVNARQHQLNLGSIGDLETRFWSGGGASGSSYTEILEEGKPSSLDLAFQLRLERKADIQQFREWELQAVQSCINELPISIRAKVLPAMEQCRLVEFGICNYVRWIATESEPVMSDADLHKLEAFFTHQMNEVKSKVTDAVAELDRKIVEALPANARKKLELQLGFPIHEFPAWRSRVAPQAYWTLWLPFESPDVQPDTARRFLRPFIESDSAQKRDMTS
jgi:hypothetical protein